MKANCILLFRENLKNIHMNNKIEDIKYIDFKGTTISPAINNHLVVFVDLDGNTKILRNRFGKEGIVK
jgi:hypothetical protein